MTTLEERLKADVKAAMKSGAKEELEVLRRLLSDAKNVAIAAGAERTGIPDDVMLKVLKKGVKTRTESAEVYTKAGRDELAGRERDQIEVIQRYLPTQLSEAEIEVVVDTVILELGATDRSAMGQVIKGVMGKLGGAADGSMVSRIVAGRLG
ncbi:MAG: GatB/YqeY domain-containing protein [Planctomycetota bacterium]|jgi:uncharacterized protein YqeY